MIVFLCAHVRISMSTYILTSIVIYLPYRLTSSDATRRCVFVYVGKLVGWKTSTFFIQFNVYKRFYFCHVFFTFFNFFIFFWNVFLHLWSNEGDRKNADKCGQGDGGRGTSYADVRKMVFVHRLLMLLLLHMMTRSKRTKMWQPRWKYRNRRYF